MLSICIPTHQRAEILAHTLAHLPDLDCEILVSDNASTDETPQVVLQAQQKDRRIRYTQTQRNLGVFGNFAHMLNHAMGDVIVRLADDDSIMLKPLKQHVQRMDDEPKLAAIFTDSIAWDDETETELHRYYGEAEEITFDAQPIEFVSYLLGTMLPPEHGVFRRNALMKAQIPLVRAMPFHIWAYNLSCIGQVEFSRQAFYREHRRLKPHLVRNSTANMDLASAYMGDEQRLGLEIMAYAAARDAGREWNRVELRDAIDRMLHNRARLEIQRAVSVGNLQLAAELQCRVDLWQNG